MCPAWRARGLALAGPRAEPDRLSWTHRQRTGTAEAGDGRPPALLLHLPPVLPAPLPSEARGWSRVHARVYVHVGARECASTLWGAWARLRVLPVRVRVCHTRVPGLCWTAEGPEIPRPPSWKQQPDLVGSEERRAQKGGRHGQSWGQGAPRRPIPGPQPAAHAVACLRLSPAGRIRRPHSPLPAGTRSPARHPVGERGAPRVFSVVRGQVTRHHRLPELLSCSPFWGRGPGRPQAAAPPARWGSAAVLLTELTFRRSLGPRHWLRAGGSASEGCCDCTARTLGPPAGSPPTSLRASFPFGEDILRTSPENPKSR